MEWSEVNEGVSVSADEKWLKVQEDGRDVIVRLSDKSLWYENGEGELVQIEAVTQDPGVEISVTEDESSESGEVCADLANLKLNLYGSVSESAHENCIYLIQPTFLPLDALDIDQCLCVTCGLTQADGSNETANFVAQHFPKVLLSTLQTLRHKRAHGEWRIDVSNTNRESVNYVQWDLRDEKISVNKCHKPADRMIPAIVEFMSILMLESTVKSIEQTARDVNNINNRRQISGGAAALVFSVFGPCTDGGLRAVLTTVGDWSACMIKRDGELVPIFPKLDTASPEGRKYQRGATPILPSSEDSDSVECNLARGFGHTQVGARTGDRQNKGVICRASYLCLLDIDIEQDARIICARQEDVFTHGWASLREIARPDSRQTDVACCSIDLLAVEYKGVLI